ncbi:hypothetical protein [Infirmifilum sp. NZ]|uniref:hypothetical protein n=1 Tax=Infirmifilum sp. NZ TaxID=2926850 RepID=UPI00279F08FE|nr:hypothetical protein [Infirmifilum sp. NZ]UNQ73761.1 hypothetical protein MOV14_01800 [Infirmifilum sp. NZ]
MSAKMKQIDEKWLLDWGARIGVAARRDGVKASQLENLIASLDSVEGREALLVTAAYALRQVQRLGVGRTMARLVAQALRELYERDYGKEEARKMLGFAKWVFEAVGMQRVSGDLSQLSLEELLKQLASAR